MSIANNQTFGKILVNAQGITLYEQAGSSTSCDSQCAKLWARVLLPAGQVSPIAGPGMTGTLSADDLANGLRQVTWNGSPLYTYTGDKKPGDVNGFVEGGIWSVAQVSSSTTTTQAPAATTTAAPSRPVSPPLRSTSTTGAPYSAPPTSPYPTCAPPC